MKLTEKQVNLIIVVAVITTIVLILGILFGTLYYQYRKSLELRSKRNAEFLSTISKIISNNIDIDTDEFIDQYMAIFGENTDKYINLNHLSYLLRKVKSELYINKDIKTEQIEKYGNVIKNSITDIADKITEMQTVKPFKDIPSPEGELLEDIFINYKNEENSYLKDKLEKLGTAIKARQETIDALSLENKNSLKWSIAGLIGTSFFGLLSIVLSVWLYKKSRKTSISLEKLREIPLEERMYGVSLHQILEVFDKDELSSYLDKKKRT